MKQIVCFIMLASIAVLSTSCNDKNDEPGNLSATEVKRGTPNRVAPLLVDYYEKYGNGELMWPSEVVDDSGLTGEAGDYSYWQEHKGEAHNFEELMAMCDIPSHKLQAMSTRNLALTCYNHPYAVNYFAVNVIYQNVFYMALANSYRELMQRKTGALELLNLYCELEYAAEPGAASYRLNALSLFLMTAVDYNALSHEQLVRLSAEVLAKIDNIFSGEGETHSFSYNLRFPYLLGAFIAYHYDESLSDYDANLLKGFVYGAGNNGFALSPDFISQASTIITQSLQRME